MSHGHTRAARIKTSKRKPTRIPHPILPALTLSSLYGRPPLSSRASVPHHPLCHHTWYTPLLSLTASLPLTTRRPPSSFPSRPSSLSPCRAQQREQEYEESKGLAHNRFTLSRHRAPLLHSTSTLTATRLNLPT